MPERLDRTVQVWWVLRNSCTSRRSKALVVSLAERSKLVTDVEIIGDLEDRPEWNSVASQVETS